MKHSQSIFERFEKFKNGEIGEYKDLIARNFADYKQQDFRDCEPSDFIDIVKENDRGAILNARRFVRDLFAPLSGRSQTRVESGDGIVLDFTGKLASSTMAYLEKQDPEFMTFSKDKILNELDNYNDLMYLDFSECGLMHQDLDILSSILLECRNLKCVDLDYNKITLTRPALESLKSLYAVQSTVIINFSGNYCEGDRETLHLIYNKEYVLLNMPSRYIWIKEIYVERGAWAPLLQEYKIEFDTDAILKAHQHFYRLKQKYTA